jgi:hypothetical protein
MIPVSARRVVMFHPSHILKALVHQQRPAGTKLTGTARLPVQQEQRTTEELSLHG